MGQHLAAMRSKRAQPQEVITTENPSIGPAPPEPNNGSTTSGKAVIEAADSGEILLGGDTMYCTPSVPAEESDATDSVVVCTSCNILFAL